MYSLHLFASATVVKLLSFKSCEWMFMTAFMTSLSLPTPLGSIIILSGAYSFNTFSNAFPKSPTRLQQMQPEFISVTSMPASCMNAPSTPISPNSFSINTSFSPLYASFMSFFMSVVLPAPKNPEKISTLVIFSRLFQYYLKLLYATRPLLHGELCDIYPFFRAGYPEKLVRLKLYRGACAAARGKDRIEPL